MALSLYACASVHCYDKEYFESSFKFFLDNNIVPSIQDFGYIVQSLAILRNSEYNHVLSDWFKSIIMN